MARRKLILIAIFILLFLALYIREMKRGETVRISEVSDEEIAKEKAMEAIPAEGLEYHGIWSAWGKSSSLLRNHTVYSVVKCVSGCSYSDLLSEDCSCIISAGVVAVGRDGEAFLLPDDFNKVVRREKIEVKSEDDALKIAFEYVNSSVVFGRAVLLRNTSDIPVIKVEECEKEMHPELCRRDYEKSREKVEGLRSTIRYPNITMEDGNYVVTFFTWKDLGGIVEMWRIEVGGDGTIALLAHEVIAREVGKYFMLR
ncbi:hypothetical protein [Candidatus Methanodesulfokora washburnensis]|jgi:regulation of enolase protein 1 (concanavalin A-like superfamily)|uniref:Uncharacterized protein n=1 Tax=Candidatus Methanodesulfokora washburnensis TaxID=2478471 RepID=A0A3R9PI39_9CREN|nr:hypothetical protein [Candidatus Methanodesulfokores washburnensis]RSN74086.1 hypothetical protein D6D85_08840 [Candidatus Methanodesulfokores washburnensis]